MTVTEGAGTAAETTKASTQKAAATARRSTGKAAGTAKESAAKAADSVGKVATSAKSTTAEAAGKVKGSTKRAVAGARATKKAKAGMVEDAKQIAGQAGAAAAADAISEADAMHYQVEVNKRGLSVTALTKTLNDRWDNGWRLAHILEQRGNTVLVFEKRT